MAGNRFPQTRSLGIEQPLPQTSAQKKRCTALSTAVSRSSDVCKVAKSKSPCKPELLNFNWLCSGQSAHLT